MTPDCSEQLITSLEISWAKESWPVRQTGYLFVPAFVASLVSYGLDAEFQNLRKLPGDSVESEEERGAFAPVGQKQPGTKHVTPKTDDQRGM